MESLAILVPLSVALVFLIGVLFWRALHGGQFEDLDKPGVDVLMDDDTPPRSKRQGQGPEPRS
ncbi:MAG: cbb3-type cytochrome oxidase assembly protein CcoS [Burkholderiales bacterium]